MIRQSLKGLMSRGRQGCKKIAPGRGPQHLQDTAHVVLCLGRASIEDRPRNVGVSNVMKGPPTDCGAASGLHRSALYSGSRRLSAARLYCTTPQHRAIRTDKRRTTNRKAAPQRTPRVPPAAALPSSSSRLRARRRNALPQHRCEPGSSSREPCSRSDRAHAPSPFRHRARLRIGTQLRARESARAWAVLIV